MSLLPLPALNAAVGREAWSLRRLGEGCIFVVASSLIETSLESYSKALVTERLTPRFPFLPDDWDVLFIGEIEAGTTVGDDEGPTAVGRSGFCRRLGFFPPPAGG